MGIRRKLSLAVAVTATVAVPLFWTAPAAADADGKCSGGWFCLYENEDFNRDKGAEGDHWRNFRENKSNLGDFNWRNASGGDSNDGMNDETSSVKNRSGCTFALYQDAGYNGAYSYFQSGPDYDDGKLANDWIGDNSASSLRELWC